MGIDDQCNIFDILPGAYKIIMDNMHIDTYFFSGSLN